MPPSTVLTVNDLGKVFGPDEIFRHVSFQVADREHVALVGVNGAGKSTLLRIIAGIDLATEGEIAIARALASPYWRRSPDSRATERSAKKRNSPSMKPCQP